MRDIYKVTIEFADGSAPVVVQGTSILAKDGALHVYYEYPSSYLVDREHRGSWPLVNIRSWRKERA